MSVFETILVKDSKSTGWNKEKWTTAPNRGVYFGDGLFETMVFKNGGIQYFELHLERLKKGMGVLGFNLSYLQEEEVLKQCLMNSDGVNLRVRWTVYRDGIGKYTPMSDQYIQMLQLTKLELAPKFKNKTVVSETIRLTSSAISHLKTTSALSYVVANKERQEKKADEIIILDSQGHIAEAGASNIFWLKNGVVFTPSLNSGCIEGVSRRIIISKLKAQSILVTEGLFPVSELLKAEKVWVSNVSGISMLETIEKVEFDSERPNLLEGLL